MTYFLRKHANYQPPRPSLREVYEFAQLMGKGPPPKNQWSRWLELQNRRELAAMTLIYNWEVE